MSVSVVAMEWAVCLALCTALFRLRASLCAEGTTDLRVPLSARGVLLRLQAALLASLLLTLGAIWAGARVSGGLPVCGRTVRGADGAGRGMPVEKAGEGPTASRGRAAHPAEPGDRIAGGADDLKTKENERLPVRQAFSFCPRRSIG